MTCGRFAFKNSNREYSRGNFEPPRRRDAKNGAEKEKEQRQYLRVSLPFFLLFLASLRLGGSNLP